jgi:cell division protein FtsB
MKAEERMSEIDPPPDAHESEPSLTARALAALRTRLALALFGVLLIGLLAVLYLNEVAAVAVANSRLQALHADQTRLQRQDAQLHAKLGTVTSPAYIDQQARALGLAPAPAGAAIVVAVHLAANGGQP